MKNKTPENLQRRIRRMGNIILILLCISCNNNSKLISKNIKSGFLNDAGIYNISGKKRNIIIKEFKDRSKIFAIRNSNNNILFQQNLNQTFSAYHYWVLYVDQNADIWYYNSDYMSYNAILFNKKTQKYEVKDLCRFKIQLPLEFKKEIEAKSSEICPF